MDTTYLWLGLTCIAALVAGDAAAQSSPVQTSGADANDRQATEDGDIIVTATRRSESLREVPTAVSAFGVEKLRDAQIASLNDLTAITPNVQISTYLTNANITIRGIGNGNFVQAGGDPGVAVHQNGVYLGQSALALQTFLDVERVEVLRGPQGTLFGRNATGGAINIISASPTSDLSYGLDMAGGFDPAMVRGSAYVSGPLNESETLLARVSVGQNYNGGFSRNRAADGPRRLDGFNDFAVRGQLEFRPTPKRSARLIVEYQKSDDSGSAVYLIGTPSGGAQFPFDYLSLLGLPPAAPIVPTAGDFGDPEGRDARVNAGLRDAEALTVAFKTDFAFGADNLGLTASYNESRNHNVIDTDGTAIPYAISDFTNRAKQLFGEIIYASDPGARFNYVLGLNYFYEDLDQRGAVIALNIPAGLNFGNGGNVKTESYAAFGRGNFQLSDTTRLFGGLRYSHDRKDMDEFLAFGLVFTAAAANKWSRVTYELGASSDLSDSLTAYAKYSTGYKSGGYSVGALIPVFDPETNESFEAGLKGALLDRSVQFNLAAFHMKYDNLQVNQIRGISAVVTNAARAKVIGIELESVIRPTEWLRVEANAAWLDATFGDFDTLDSARPALGVLDLSGNQLPNAPEWAGSIGIYNDFAVGQGTLTPGVRFDWSSRKYFTEFNIPVASEKASGRLNLFLNYRSGDERWRASLFATNLTVEQQKSNVTIVSALLGSLAEATYQPGRQVGVSLGYRF
ncbi:MAG: hypothetical protein EOP62_02665 [Sphingomonadales bacterium]|nr:MAG: hypothetical protein EOP62_02665 [Sphingomonadales bacterium]